jgi:carbon-monoxide dehydrogenase iron sulfur subunit
VKNRRIYTNPDLCTGCNLCASACSVRRWGACSPKKAAIVIWQDPFERFEGQQVCRHCEEPHCLEACMNGCISKDPETGVVEHEASRCVGCWMCVMVCPHGAISTGGVNEKGNQVAVRCDLCAGEEEPLCVLVCPTGALASAPGDDRVRSGDHSSK